MDFWFFHKKLLNDTLVAYFLWFSHRSRWSSKRFLVDINCFATSLDLQSIMPHKNIKENRRASYTDKILPSSWSITKKLEWFFQDRFKVGPLPSKKNYTICFIESPLKTTKNAFYFILKDPFILKIFKFLSWLYQVFIKFSSSGLIRPLLVESSVIVIFHVIFLMRYANYVKYIW